MQMKRDYWMRLLYSEIIVDQKIWQLQRKPRYRTIVSCGLQSMNLVTATARLYRVVSKHGFSCIATSEVDQEIWQLKKELGRERDAIAH